MSNSDYKQHVRWQIPRASLSSGSRSFHSSTDSIQTFEQLNQRQKQRRRESYSVGQRKNIPVIEEGPFSMPLHTHSLSSGSVSSSSTFNGKCSSLPHKKSQQQQLKQQLQEKKFSRKKLLTENLDEIVVVGEAAKETEERVHGSSSRSSSQGSSSNSLHSASSLLLSVQNLEKFTRLAGNGSVNKTHMILKMNRDCGNDGEDGAENEQPCSRRAKESDQMSIASSTHFTLINGCGRANLKQPRSSFCRHGRQITVLIVTMTTVFTIFILGILYLMDRRAKSMPAYHQ